MKKHVLEFIRKGLIACGFGPMILALVYLILQRELGVQSLTVNEVCLGIFSLSALAFVAGGMNCIYQLERLPLALASLIHGAVLYLSYMGTYLLNGWLERGTKPVLVFSGIFVFGYLMVWAVIYFATRRKTTRLNRMLKEKQKLAE